MADGEVGRIGRGTAGWTLLRVGSFRGFFTVAVADAVSVAVTVAAVVAVVDVAGHREAPVRMEW